LCLRWRVAGDRKDGRKEREMEGEEVRQEGREGKERGRESRRGQQK